ncbi:MAG: MBL fold metallo-hydrolase [Chloroflexaceae bacterium]|nr:MBL fold metallo-hydrolase [Chloroflexaceae bacterium]
MAEQSSVTLQPVDAVEVTILVDNVMDALLPSTPQVRRATLHWDSFEHPPLLAEHGFAALLTVEQAGRRTSVLYDTGMGPQTLVHNMDVLGVDPADLRAIVLSHGHTDHHGGLHGLLARLGPRRLPLILHPDSWRDRKAVFPGGAELHLPAPGRADLEREGVEIIERRDPSLLLDGQVLVTGQIERVTPFERGMPGHFARTADGAWEADPWIWDDQALVVNVRDQGLVVLSACSHAGIVNVLRYARHLTGVATIQGVIGGLHLSGGVFEPIIPDTVAALTELAPALIVPGHCTGWKAQHALARALPDAYVQTCVGTRIRFG